jgi:hypothetical protein
MNVMSWCFALTVISVNMKCVCVVDITGLRVNVLIALHQNGSCCTWPGSCPKEVNNGS